MKPVAIIGAGITGLTAAFYLKRAGVPVTVYEAGERAGGVIHSLRRDGFLAESGPNTILETSPKIAQLVRDAGLAGRKLNTRPDADARFVVRGRQALAMPLSPLGIFRSKLLSIRAKFALLREPFVAARRDGVEESVAQFVTRRLDQEFLDRMVDALVAGIYAGDPYKLSIQHALPRLAQLEEKYGSLIKGQFLGARERKRTGEVARDRAPKFSFDEGLQVLPDTLAADLGDALKLNTPVTGLAPGGTGWRIMTTSGGAEYSAVIYCGTAYRLAELQAAGPPDFSLFSEIRYPPVASVVLGFRHEDVAHSCQGFGMLIPRLEGFNILGTIFSSALFPNRAPDGHVLLTSYVGGERQPQLASLPPDQLVPLVCKDLGVLLGVRSPPKFVHTFFNPRAIPQYNVGYGRYKELLADIETRSPGLFFAGCYRDGVSLGDSIVSGVNMAERVSKYF
jgi:oxygen-dependent protoporphyrinogen oxidase